MEGKRERKKIVEKEDIVGNKQRKREESYNNGKKVGEKERVAGERNRK